MLKSTLRKLQKDESGQSLVELVLILPLLIMLLTLPVDYFRYINTKMILSSAASEFIGDLNYTSANSGTAQADILHKVDIYYGDSIDSSKVHVSHYAVGAATDFDNDYKYWVYSSDLADPNPANYWDQFDGRDSDYHVAPVELQLSYDMEPITFWGVLFLGSNFEVETPVYTREVYESGYKP
jgi:hypothetical protein